MHPFCKILRHKAIIINSRTFLSAADNWHFQTGSKVPEEHFHGSNNLPLYYSRTAGPGNDQGSEGASEEKRQNLL